MPPPPTHTNLVRFLPVAGAFLTCVAVVGAILGRTMGLRARQIIPTVMVAIGVTTLGWLLIFFFGFALMAAVDPILPRVAAVAVFVFVLSHAAVSVYRVHRNGYGRRPR